MHCFIGSGIRESGSVDGQAREASSLRGLKVGRGGATRKAGGGQYRVVATGKENSVLPSRGEAAPSLETHIVHC